MEGTYFFEELKESLKNIQNRYKTALYSFQLYIHLHRTLDSDIHTKEGAEKNCELRNDLSWILGENIEIIFLHHTILTLYSLFEHKIIKNTGKIQRGDIDSLYLLIEIMEENKYELNKRINAENNNNTSLSGDKISEIDDKFLEKVKSELELNEVFIQENLRHFRNQIGHNFQDSKRIPIVVNTQDLEKFITQLGVILNKITSKFPGINQILYETFGQEIADDYRRLFFFLGRQKKISELMTFGNLQNETIIQELNKIYRPHMLNR